MLNETQALKISQLVLGFDASCGKCSSMAEQLKDDVGSAVDVIPLNNPQMKEWRTDVFTAPPWAPTLIRVDGDGKALDGWVGWKIGPVLGSRLGPQAATRALKNIGAQRLEASGGKWGVASRSRTSRRGLARLAFGVAGLAAGAATVTGMSGAAFAKGSSSNLQVSNEDNLDQPSAADLLRKQLDSADAQNVLAFSAAGAGPEALNRLSSTSEIDSPEVGAKRMTLADGTISEASYSYNKATGEMLVVQENSELVDGRASVAWVLEVSEDPNDFNESSFKILEKSVNGSLVRRLDSVVDSEGREALKLAADDPDPCGGCNGVCQIGGEEFRESCYSSSVVSCVLAAAGCAGCVACSGTGACIFCAITSCGGVLLSCCNETTGPACERCNRVC